MDVNFRGGKYNTALQAAAYADRLDILNVLLDHGADFRIRGGMYGNALNAAAIKGNKSVLSKLLEKMPPEQMLDEALVEACYHRQSDSVEKLFKARANVLARHPSLGSPLEALKADPPDGYNSDDQKDETDGDEDDDSEDEDSDEEWEGDDGESDDETEASVTDLQLDEEVTEEMKIQKLIDDQMARVKRNPGVQRFGTVKRKAVGPPNPALPRSLAAGPPSQQSYPAQYTQFNPQQQRSSSYGSPEYQDPRRESYQPYRGPQQTGHVQVQATYQPPPSNAPLPHYQTSNSSPHYGTPPGSGPSPTPARKPVGGYFQQQQNTAPPGYNAPPPLPSRPSPSNP